MIGKLHFAAVYALLLAAAVYLHVHSDISVPMNRPLDQFPADVGSWRMSGESTLSEEVLQLLRPTDYLMREYVGPAGKRVELYIGYHNGGKKSGQIHSPKQCLPGSGWFKVSSIPTEMDVAGERVHLVQAVYRQGETKELFLYWFQVKGKTLSDEYGLKFAEIENSILYRRRDASFIRISVPFTADQRSAAATGDRFVKDFLPAIDAFLPH